MGTQVPPERHGFGLHGCKGPAPVEEEEEYDDEDDDACAADDDEDKAAAEEDEDDGTTEEEDDDTLTCRRCTACATSNVRSNSAVRESLNGTNTWWR